MINDNSTGYWDYSNEIAPQWMEYGDPGARSAPGTINIGGMGPSPSITGAGGMPVGGSNPILTSGTPGNTAPNSGGNPLLSAYGPPGSLAPPSPTPVPGSQFTPNPFMTPGMTFQPRTQFGQQASAPLNINQQGRTYGQMPGGPNMAQQPPAFQSVRPGGSSGFMPQFRNPYGPQPKQPPGGEIGIGDFMRDQLRNIYGPQTQQPQQYRQMGQQPSQIYQQPLQQAGLPALMPNRALRNY